MFLDLPIHAQVRLFFLCLSFVVVNGRAGDRTVAQRAETDLAENAKPLFQQFCFDCHGEKKTKAGINLERMAAAPDFAGLFKQWEKVIAMLTEKEMPPEDKPQPSDAQRQKLIESVRNALDQFIRERAGDPGRITMRQLTSAEYGYAIQDLTGLDLGLERGFVSDAVGGEGFSNVGDVQFIQESALERYLEAAKQLSAHAVVGAGPLRFYRDPGRTGQELSAIARIQEIYKNHGFRTASGEGGKAFGLERYSKAFYSAWRFRYRRELGLRNMSLDKLAEEEGIDQPFGQYIWESLNHRSLTFPSSEIAAAWRKLPAPADHSPAALARARAECDKLYQQLKDWQIAFAENNGDAEVAMVLTETSFRPSLTNSFRIRLGWPLGTTNAAFEIAAVPLAGKGSDQPAVLWRRPSLRFRQAGANLNQGRGRLPGTPLRNVASLATRERLNFGRDSRGVAIQSNDFVTVGAVRLPVEFAVPAGTTQAELTIDAELDLTRGDDCVVRCQVVHDLTEGATVAASGTFSALLANPEGKRIESLKSGVAEFARTFPQISHREAAPADRDPIPAPFDSGYNHPERNEFHYDIKYHRDDAFLTEHMLDRATRRQLDEAWADLLTSFDYHHTFLRFVARKYQLDLGEQTLADLSGEWVEHVADEPKQFVTSLLAQFRSDQRRLRAAEPGHVEDALAFAQRAWRRPLNESEKLRLRTFYGDLRNRERIGHAEALRMLLTRILVAPSFLYRVESIQGSAGERGPAGTDHSATAPSQTSAGTVRAIATRGSDSGPGAAPARVPLSDWDLASRLSFFLWSSIPDAELVRAAAAGELRKTEQLTRHAERMLRDPKARRFAAEFFGQWFGFYRFDGYRGVDTTRFTEFTDRLKAEMYDEAVSFFDYLVREDRPVRDVLFANYSFLNRDLAQHYGIDVPNLSSNAVAKTEGVHQFHRGGLLGLGAVLTSTSAPLRTSAVKRGDWVLRRVLGQTIPPPPGDAGSIPPDDLLGDGKTVRQRLEAHRRDASCVNCHARFDPLGFALEHFDSLGRWRERYRDGQEIDATGTLNDGTKIVEFEGLLEYLRNHESSFNRTLCAKLLGYALGRAELVSDRPLLQQMTAGLVKDNRFSTLVAQIVSSPQFRYRRAASSEPGVAPKQTAAIPSSPMTNAR